MPSIPWLCKIARGYHQFGFVCTVPGGFPHSIHCTKSSCSLLKVANWGYIPEGKTSHVNGHDSGTDWGRRYLPYMFGLCFRPRPFRENFFFFHIAENYGTLKRTSMYWILKISHWSWIISAIHQAAWWVHAAGNSSGLLLWISSKRWGLVGWLKPWHRFYRWFIDDL